MGCPKPLIFAKNKKAADPILRTSHLLTHSQYNSEVLYLKTDQAACDPCVVGPIDQCDFIPDIAVFFDL